MRPDLAEIAAYLRCPDDGASLAASRAGVACGQCGRSFHLQQENIVELMPTRPRSLPASPYAVSYQQEFDKPIVFRQDAEAWGAPERLPPKIVQRRQRQASEVLQFLSEDGVTGNKVMVDLSAGAGDCTFPAARKYWIVFHCDLSADAIVYASQKAMRENLTNIVFIRADYFQLPFRASVDHLACLDTLIRGEWHERLLLTSIQNALASSGAAVVDFHNWWHNPLRRIGLQRNNFVNNRSYTSSSLRTLLADSGVAQYEMKPFVQEADPKRRSSKFLSKIFPAARFMVRLNAAQESHGTIPVVQRPSV